MINATSIAAEVAPKGFLLADWPAPASVRAYSTTRDGLGVSLPPFDRFNLGARCGDEPSHVAANRAALMKAGGLPSAPNWLQQVHGTGVVRVDAPPREGAQEPEADAALTSTPGVVLAITPSSVAAARSILSNPTPHREIIFN